MNKEQRNNKIMTCLSKSVIYRPNIMEISRKTKIPNSTIFDFYNKLKKENRVIIHVEILTKKELK